MVVCVYLLVGIWFGVGLVLYCCVLLGVEGCVGFWLYVVVGFG